MAGKKRGLIGFARAFALVVWVIVSVVFYGTTCLVCAFFNKGISRAFAFLWMHHLMVLSGVKVVVRGYEKLRSDRRYVFISNHQSHLDIPVLYSALRRPLSFIAKKELFRIPFFGWGMYALGHIWIDRDNARKAHASIKRAVERLQQGNISLVLFPEGTRSVDGVVGPFKQGSFSLVQQAGVEVVPLAIRRTAGLLPKHTMLISSGTAELIIGDPISVDENMPKAQISEQIRSIIQEALLRADFTST